VIEDSSHRDEGLRRDVLFKRKRSRTAKDSETPKESAMTTKKAPNSSKGFWGAVTVKWLQRACALKGSKNSGAYVT